MNDLVSIIVPVYNVELYLEQCLNSLINQTYKQLEIILIDDGSTDESPIICDNYYVKDKRIKVIHKMNGGLSDARNVGLNVASGKYIMFVDSDDLIDLKMVEIFVNIMNEKNADIIECDYCMFWDSFKELNNNDKNEILIFNKDEALYHLFKEDVFKHVVWNKFYKKELFDDILFEKGKLHEDLFFSYRIFEKINKIVKVNHALYYYRQRSNSIMNAKISDRNLDAVEARQRQYEYFKNNDNLNSLLLDNLLGSCLYFMQKALMQNDKEIIKIFESKLKPLFLDKNNKRKFTYGIKKEIWYFLASITFIGCCKIRNKLGIGL